MVLLPMLHLGRDTCRLGAIFAQINRANRAFVPHVQAFENRGITAENLALLGRGFIGERQLARRFGGEVEQNGI